MKILKNPWPVAIIAYFIVFITLMAGWITFAVRNDLELVRSDYYDHELKFQRQIDQAARARSVQQQISITYDASTRAIQVMLPPEPKPLRGQINLYRPSQQSLDQTIPLETAAQAQQLINAANLQQGLWRIRVSWSVPGHDYYFEQPLVLPPPATP